jgi:hypothetical protein
VAAGKEAQEERALDAVVATLVHIYQQGRQLGLVAHENTAASAKAHERKKRAWLVELTGLVDQHYVKFLADEALLSARSGRHGTHAACAQPAHARRHAPSSECSKLSLNGRTRSRRGGGRQQRLQVALV